MRGKRAFLFLVMIALGLVAGLIYGWIIRPTKSATATVDTLRADYRTDYILMVAEIYHSDNNLEQATRRLGLLGSTPPARLADEGITNARSLGYGEADLALMNQLEQALAAQAGNQGTVPSETRTPGSQP